MERHRDPYLTGSESKTPAFELAPLICHQLQRPYEDAAIPPLHAKKGLRMGCSISSSEIDTCYFSSVPELGLDCCPTSDKDTPPPANQDCVATNPSWTRHWQLRGEQTEHPLTQSVSAGGLLKP